MAVGHIENFFAFMSCLIEQMGHKKEVLHHMSRAKGKGDIKGMFYAICLRAKEKRDITQYVHTKEEKEILK